MEIRPSPPTVTRLSQIHATTLVLVGDADIADVLAYSGAIDNDRAPRPVADAISALVNLGYGQPQATAAVASASRSAGEHAETAQLIRLGLKELAK